jgi:imidazolonepropionase-like amidohydrolase
MSARILLRNAHVLACTGEPAERPFAGDVLIEDGRIAAVSRRPLQVSDARVIDLSGSTILPGLGDAHTHISWPLDFTFNHKAIFDTAPEKHMLDVVSVVRTFVESGYTTIIGAGVTQPGDDLLAKDAIERGLIPGPRIIPSGMMIAAVGGLGSDGEMMQIAGDAEGLRALVRAQCEQGIQALKLFISGDGIVPEYPSEDTYMDDEMLSAAVDEAAKYDAIITTHARSAESVAMAARSGVRIVHHACFLDDDAIHALEARGEDVFVCPGLHYLYAMVSGHAEPWGMDEARIVASGYGREFDAQVDGLRKLHAAGVPILSGGDFGHQWTHHGTYAAELQRYVELIGMTPVEAIYTATRNIGAVTGAQTGQVREGYLADLLVVDGDPAEDITVLQDPARRRMVIKDGQIAYLNATLYP